MPANHSVKRNLDMIEKDTAKVLGVKVGSHEVTPGVYIPKADAQDAPELSFASSSPSQTYMMVALDIDAPFPSFGVLGPILHWIQPGLKVSGSTLKAEQPFVANYIGPAPPPGSGPHRYCFFLYEQPEGFDGKKYAPADGKPLSNWHRMRYDLDHWEKEAKLSPAVATNYFTSN